MKLIMACILLIAACGCFTAVWLFNDSWLLQLAFLVAAADLVSTVFWEPLIGPGPLAKAAYQELDQD